MDGWTTTIIYVLLYKPVSDQRSTNICSLYKKILVVTPAYLINSKFQVF